jgi:two-component system response regulator HydG
MRALRADIDRFAPRTATVLVTGESGAGKELVARALHDGSARVSGAFVAVNVATLRRELLGSELFGHVRGAFTGAVDHRQGLFAEADGGTLFLDEIGELDLRAQAELLRVLETREVRPLGGGRTRTVDVRVLAATHRDLWAMVMRGEFREDLYYRLNILTLRVPPLRARIEDLPTLIGHLLARQREECGERSVNTHALECLARYPWPGNVRQLANVLCRAAARSDAPVLDADVILAALAEEPGVTDAGLYRVDDARIDAALRASRGSVAAAARRLGIPRTTLRNRLRLRAQSPGALHRPPPLPA